MNSNSDPSPLPEDFSVAKRRASILPLSEASKYHDTPSDSESEKSSSTIASTVTLSSKSSFDEKSDESLSDSFSPTQKSTPDRSKVSAKCISDKDRPKELPTEFVVPTKFGKITDSNLRKGDISDTDRAKVIKTVATCVWVHTDTPSPTCCEWLAKQLISKYPVLADADPRSMLAKEQSGLRENFRYWVRIFISCKILDILSEAM